MFGLRAKNTTPAIEEAICKLDEAHEALCETCSATLLMLANIPPVTVPNAEIDAIVERLKDFD